MEENQHGMRRSEESRLAGTVVLGLKCEISSPTRRCSGSREVAACTRTRLPSRAHGDGASAIAVASELMKPFEAWN